MRIAEASHATALKEAKASHATALKEAKEMFDKLVVKSSTNEWQIGILKEYTSIGYDYFYFEQQKYYKIDDKFTAFPVIVFYRI